MKEVLEPVLEKIQILNPEMTMDKMVDILIGDPIYTVVLLMFAGK